MKVVEICVLPDVRQIKLIVEMPMHCYHTAQAPHLPRHLFRLFPRLARHHCENGLGLTFREEARHTEIPHLFEHLLVELQLYAQHADDLTLRGVTEWNWQRDPRGRFHVMVDYENELLAVGAIRLAERILSCIDRRDIAALDIEREISRLCDLARLAREVIGMDSVSLSPSVKPAETTLPVGMPNSERVPVFISPNFGNPASVPA